MILKLQCIRWFLGNVAYIGVRGNEMVNKMEKMAPEKDWMVMQIMMQSWKKQQLTSEKRDGAEWEVLKG